MSTTLQNIYYQRKVGTAKACYVCNRPTQTVLATIKAEDFLYTCDSHLSDPGFASPIATAGPSADDIRKVIAEYSARDARRTAAATPPSEKNTEKDKAKEDDRPKSWGATLLSGAGSVASAAASGVAALASPTSGSETASKPASPGPPSPGGPNTTGIPSVPAQTHNKYALHRSFFESRRAELRRREQAARAKEVSKDMPQVPRGF